MISILFVEDEADQRFLVKKVLEKAKYTVYLAESAEEGIRVLNEKSVHLVLSDWKLPGQSGAQLLQYVRDQFPEVGFVMVTAYGSIERAVQAIQAGADDYLSKPYERQHLLLAIEKALKTRALSLENQKLNAELHTRQSLVDLVGQSPGMQRVYNIIEKIAPTQATVLITGESGTGKELTARAVHALSKRRAQPFVAVNCAAIPGGLMESEFFGHERGAFTGADRQRKGKFEAAQGGTLFLDEIGELALTIQPKLLRAVQEQEIVRVGGNQAIPVDTRIVVATHRNLAQEVSEGHFREDLYYRLNVIQLPLPALRERREDIPLLAPFLVRQAAKKHGLEQPILPKSLLRTLMDYTWPGNVRELANVLERLVLFCESGQLSEVDLPESFQNFGSPKSNFKVPPEGLDWENVEKSCLCQALALSHGNKAKAAKLMSMSYKTFLYRLEKHDIV